MRKYVTFFLAMVMAISFSACVKKPSEKELFTQNLAVSTAKELTPHRQLPEKMQTLYEKYLDEMEIGERTRLELLNAHASRVSVDVVSAENGIAEVKITGPDLSELLKGIVNTSEFPNDENAKIKIKQKMTEAIVKGAYSEKEWVVSVTYIMEQEKMIITESFDYLDAIYGGLLSLNQTAEQQLQEAMKHADK